MHLPTRSAHDPLYRELETYIEKKLLTRAPQQSNRESILSQRMTDLESVMRSAEGGGVPPDAHGRALLASVYSAQEPLPTVYDDPMNHWLAAFLLKTVRKAADELGFPSTGYGGFCCAPTGSVNAQAVPIRVDSASSKVFVVFESGLFTFIDGVISAVLDATPLDLLQGSTLEDWLGAWRSFSADPPTSLKEAAVALDAWIRFFSSYNNREGLTFSAYRSLGPNGQKLRHDMVLGCELFVTGHEYIHAIAGHQNPQLDPKQVERQADALGAQISQQAFIAHSVNLLFALAGITVFMKAIERHGSATPHLAAAPRLELLMDAMHLTREQRGMCRDVSKLFSVVFEDTLSIARE